MHLHANDVFRHRNRLAGNEGDSSALADCSLYLNTSGKNADKSFQELLDLLARG